MRTILICIIYLLPVLSFSQTSYDRKIIGRWTGTISGAGLPAKSLTLFITKSLYSKEYCEGYSMVNNGNRTSFSGTFMVEADIPILELSEPATSPKNGIFHLEFGCYDENDNIQSDVVCGTWTSFDGKLKRKIKLQRPK